MIALAAVLALAFATGLIWVGGGRRLPRRTRLAPPATTRGRFTASTGAAAMRRVIPCDARATGSLTSRREMSVKPEHRSRWVNKRTCRVAIVWRDEISADSVFYRYEDYWYEEMSGLIHDMHGEFFELPVARFHELFVPQVILGPGRPRTSDDTLRRRLGREWFPTTITTSTKYVHRYRTGSAS